MEDDYKSIVEHLERARGSLAMAMAHMYKAIDEMRDSFDIPGSHITNFDIVTADRINWSLECDRDMLKALSVELKARH